MPEYRGRTTVVVTSDHGRGKTLADFNGHGAKVEGANQIWMAFAGPDTPAQGEMTNAPEVMQRDVAPTILELLGIDPASYKGVLGQSIRAVFEAKAQRSSGR
jgi:arylsulfatase A-like enzyme